MQTHLVTAQPFPRRDFLDIAEVAILLDVDGTILDVAATPQGVAEPASLVRTLAELHGRTGGALALVSGRLIEKPRSPVRAAQVRCCLLYTSRCV